MQGRKSYNGFVVAWLPEAPLPCVNLRLTRRHCFRTERLLPRCWPRVTETMRKAYFNVRTASASAETLHDAVEKACRCNMLYRRLSMSASLHQQHNIISLQQSSTNLSPLQHFTRQLEVLSVDVRYSNGVGIQLWGKASLVRSHDGVDACRLHTSFPINGCVPTRKGWTGIDDRSI
jgi:hypothetical protein